MSQGTYGIVRGADITPDDVEIFYHFTPSRDKLGNSGLIKLNANEVLFKIDNPNKSQSNVTGFEVFGGTNAPYIWLKTPSGQTSWEFFDELLTKANVVVTPGSGFGLQGEGYVRLSAFGDKEDIKKAMKNIRENFKLQK